MPTRSRAPRRPTCSPGSTPSPRLSGSLSTVHEAWAWVMIVANGVAGGWALAAVRYAPARRRELWWFTAAAQVSVFVQVVLGVALVALEDVEVSQFHMFYGFISFIAVAIIYSYRQQLREHVYLLYGFGGLFVMGLGLRAVQVGTRA